MVLLIVIFFSFDILRVVGKIQNAISYLGKMIQKLNFGATEVDEFYAEVVHVGLLEDSEANVIGLFSIIFYLYNFFINYVFPLL